LTGESSSDTISKTEVLYGEQNVVNTVLQFTSSAKRLQRLSEDILDVTRIENQSLCLKEEQFNLNDVITNAINDAKANNDFLKKTKNAIIIGISASSRCFCTSR
jgi:K+-sensing histidine kinase KdpD